MKPWQLQLSTLTANSSLFGGDVVLDHTLDIAAVSCTIDDLTSNPNECYTHEMRDEAAAIIEQ